ncbi:MAG TPA: nickel-type superoxide dismutase maturation protease [Tepidiformaceae bacterium]
MKREADEQPRWLVRLAICSVLAEIAAAIAWLKWRYSRYAVAGASMEPALHAGDYVVVDRKAFARRLPRPGDVVLAADPREPSRTLVKRVTWVDLHGQLWLEGDNPRESTDSRVFGRVPPRGLVGRVVFRYWPLLR